MRKDRSLGLDELMIVNPGLSPGGAGLRPGEFFLGDDGTLYQLQMAGGSPGGRANPRSQRPRRRKPALRPHSLYLGDDGALYQLR